MQPREFLPDQHTIETPEQMSLHVALAGIGSRFLALLIDTLIQVGIGLGALIILAILNATGVISDARAFRNWGIAAFFVIAFLVMYGYFAIFEIVWSGQTPGKRMVGIRVVKDSGRPLNAGEIIGRNLMRIVDQLPAFYALGILVALLNAKHKRLGDLLAGSIVVREASLAELKPIWQAPREVGAELTMDTSQLTAEDLTLIDTFLARRENLEHNLRATTAAQIVSRLRPKIPSGIDATNPAEAILEALSYQKRSTGYMHR